MGAAEEVLERAEEARAAGRAGPALELIDQALLADPRLAKAWIKKAEILGSLDKAADALACFAMAEAVEPLPAEARLPKARALCLAERFDEAVALVTQVLSGDQSNADAWCVRGLALVGMGWQQEAQGAFETALGLDPTNGEAARGKKAVDRALATGGAVELNEADTKRRRGSWWRR